MMGTATLEKSCSTCRWLKSLNPFMCVPSFLCTHSLVTSEMLDNLRVSECQGLFWKTIDTLGME